MGALKTFIFFKKCTTNHTQMGNDYAFKDSILDCIQTKISSTDRRRECDDESLNTTSTAMTPPPRERRLVMDLSDRLEGGRETTEWFIFYQM